MNWERRADIASYLGIAFVAGWIACQHYYKLQALWDQHNLLVNEVTQESSSCNNLRRDAIIEMLRDQDEFGKAPDWGKIKSCPKATVPILKK